MITKMKKTIIAILLSVACGFCFMPAWSDQALAASKNPGKVSHIKVTRKGDVNMIRWKKGKNATSYYITYQKGKGQNKITDTDLAKKTYYKVKSKHTLGYVKIVSRRGRKKSKAKTWGKEDKTPEAYEFLKPDENMLINADTLDSNYCRTKVRISVSSDDDMRYATSYEIKVSQGYLRPKNKKVYNVTKRATTVIIDNPEYDDTVSPYATITVTGVGHGKKSKAVVYRGVDASALCRGDGVWLFDDPYYLQCIDYYVLVKEGKETYRAALSKVMPLPYTQPIEMTDDVEEAIHRETGDSLETVENNYTHAWVRQIIDEDAGAPKDGLTASYCRKMADIWIYLLYTCHCNQIYVDYEFRHYLIDNGINMRDMEISDCIPKDYSGPRPWDYPYN